MGRELSETGVRCEKSYWKSSQPVKIWQNNIVVVTKIVFVGHPTKKYSTYPNLSQLFRHFHGFIKGSPCPHRTHGTWDTTPIDPSPSRGRRPTPSVVPGAERAERSASGSNLVALMEPKLLVWDSRNHFYVEPHSR